MIDNEKCVVVEFVNDSNKVAVGYVDWCECEESDLNHIISEKKEIFIGQ